MKNNEGVLLGPTTKRLFGKGPILDLYENKLDQNFKNWPRF
jgi:hypothetical protein